MKLYEYAEEFNELLSRLEDEDMDLELLEMELNRLNTGFNTKMDNIAKYIKSLRAEAEAIKIEENRLMARRKARENKAEFLKKYIEDMLNATNRKDLKTELFSFNIQKNIPSLVIENEDIIPMEYKKTVISIDKKSLLDAIKAGNSFDGVSLKSTESIRIR